jgi:glycosyltransferase involved in cell wall biosynthesis
MPTESIPHVRRDLSLADLWDFYSEQRSTPLTLRLRELEAFQVSAFNVHALLTTIERFKPEVVYVWMLVGIGGLGLVACLQHLGIPWVWHLMDEVPTKLCSLFYRAQPELARELSREFDGSVLACSQQLIDEIDRAGISLNNRVQLLPNWVVGRRPPARAARDRTAPLRIVASAALLDRNYDKGIDLLIEAAALLVERGYDGFSLDIYGHVNDGSFGELIRQRGVYDRVSLIGAIEQASLQRAYSRYDLFAFPGRPTEPFGFAPLEAMAEGCVALIHHRAGVGEWLVHGVHCLKVARNAESFSRAIQVVLDGAVDLKPIARRSTDLVWRDFHLDSLLPTVERALRAASVRPRRAGGTAADAYRLAILAEKVSIVLMHEACTA